MHAKMIALGAIIVLILATVILEMAVFGNHEEMAEVEYEEYQIKIDYGKMARGVLGLFGIEVNTPRRHVSQEEQATEGEAGINSQAPVVQPAPTAPTISTMPVFGEE